MLNVLLELDIISLAAAIGRIGIEFHCFVKYPCPEVVAALQWMWWWLKQFTWKRSLGAFYCLLKKVTRTTLLVL
jgi:hypothetical protein